MRIYAFLAINALVILLVIAVLSFTVLKYRNVWHAASRDASRLRGKLVDFPETRFYEAANAGLPPPGSNPIRVVFLGDSITQRWDLSESGLPYEAINRGIGWQTTSEMLVRLRPDVIELRPRAVVILGGANDFAPQCGPLRLGTTQNNIRSMAELAHQHGIAVVIGTVPPICAERISNTASLPVTLQLRKDFNQWLRNYCDGQTCRVADFEAVMSDRPACDYLIDGGHPNRLGYEVMTKVAREALQQSLTAH
jgi:lysophospholipase L1-like esterase